MKCGASDSMYGSTSNPQTCFSVSQVDLAFKFVERHSESADGTDARHTNRAVLMDSILESLPTALVAARIHGCQDAGQLDTLVRTGNTSMAGSLTPFDL